ncbi:hypothetical protein [Terricaulis sp.]|nr:hypothetical protein [Terricaulis sp.]MDZ4689978.1 hypothetical protein [Terricaulis sp.]
MIEGGWSFVYAAYAIVGVALAVLAAVVVFRLRYWAKRAKELKRS